MIENMILNYWPFTMGMITLIVWLVRLEGKVKQNAVDIEEFKEEKKDEIKDITKKLDHLNTTLTNLCINFAELSGYIKRFNEEKE